MQYDQEKLLAGASEYELDLEENFDKHIRLPKDEVEKLKVILQKIAKNHNERERLRKQRLIEG